MGNLDERSNVKDWLSHVTAKLDTFSYVVSRHTETAKKLAWIRDHLAYDTLGEALERAIWDSYSLHRTEAGLDPMFTDDDERCDPPEERKP